jgi:hypothetical protein
MSELKFDILNWLAASVQDPLERETLASLTITAGPNGKVVTKVEDTIAHAVRSHINVPAHSLARWLAVNWWRLRWEPSRDEPSFDWLCAHSLAAIGGDYAWPGLTFSSDGEYIQVRLSAEEAPDVAAIRYLDNIAFDIPVGDFEQAVESLLDEVQARISLQLPGESELTELRDELRQERQDPTLASAAKVQALAGFDPGSAPDEWIQLAHAIVDQSGTSAAEEIFAATPMLKDGLREAQTVLEAMRSSSATVKLDRFRGKPAESRAGEIPWERGARMARDLRKRLSIPVGQLANKVLEDLLDTELPLPSLSWKGTRCLRGGYRNAVTQGRTALLVTNQRNDSQRFYLSRVIAAALQASDEQHVLPVSNTGTALQKSQRSFAQELLCPWEALDAFSNDRGTDDDSIAEAAEHFQVSEQVVLTTLVNKGKLPRSRLPT